MINKIIAPKPLTSKKQPNVWTYLIPDQKHALFLGKINVFGVYNIQCVGIIFCLTILKGATNAKPVEITPLTEKHLKVVGMIYLCMLGTVLTPVNSQLICAVVLQLILQLYIVLYNTSKCLYMYVKRIVHLKNVFCH